MQATAAYETMRAMPLAQLRRAPSAAGRTLRDRAAGYAAALRARPRVLPALVVVGAAERADRAREEPVYSQRFS